MARLPELRAMADEHGLKLISIHDLIVYRLKLVPVEELSMVRNYMLGEMCRSYESVIFIIRYRIKRTEKRTPFFCISLIDTDTVRTIKRDPFAGYKLESVPVNHRYLTGEQFAKLTGVELPTYRLCQEAIRAPNNSPFLSVTTVE